MAMLESAGRIVATLVAMVQTRLELAAVEVEEESLRFLNTLLLSLLALFLVGLAVLLGSFFIILLFWDTYRFAAVLGLAAVYLVAGVALFLRVRANMVNKPRLLQQTMAELAKDIEAIKNATADPHASESH
ncbi:phage holin family protein [Massilia sp. TS11]|uniref:phage holin family protein n=1 Tax=Massilia sp. TS11 TaxID=2908003 RepID=UPI001EDC1169|nr:phage holin family protein [Massilia sp. TS11]MCG2585375.1 phage holin family protein [Massilia sp. TS11]